MHIGSCNSIKIKKELLGSYIKSEEYMKEFRRLWREDKWQLIFIMCFSLVYFVAGLLWILAPDLNSYSFQRVENIQIFMFVFGWTAFFLNFPPVILLPLLGIVGALTGKIVSYLVRLKSPYWILGWIVLLILTYINNYLGMFFYSFLVLEW